MDRNVTLTIEESLFDHPLCCQATLLDQGLHVLLTGGCKSHIGAVSTCRPGEKADTRYFPGHKDQFLSGPWAQKLSEKTGQTVCVVCGIHYDDATAQQITQIMQTADDMLSRLLTQL